MIWHVCACVFVCVHVCVCVLACVCVVCVCVLVCVCMENELHGTTNDVSNVILLINACVRVCASMCWSGLLICGLHNFCKK